jgi:hypothetical protein
MDYRIIAPTVCRPFLLQIYDFLRKKEPECDVNSNPTKQISFSAHIVALRSLL